MYLKRLEISGFKSFAKKGELEFNVPISAIVGPNGSGKSNIAEAFRFVLGEQSIKSLRGKRGEDLIFNGSSGSADGARGETARGNRASVKITFDNSKRFLDIDFDEVTVERVVYRDGLNEYLINGSIVRLKDVVELLSRAHIGPSGHHIISQGEADRILNSNPKERKGMIEEALGLKMYQYKREESKRKLEKTEENIKSVESLRREILPHIKFLKKQVEKIEQARELKDKLSTLYKEYFKREKIFLDREAAEIERAKRPIVEKQKQLEKNLAEAKKVLSSSATFDAKSKEIIALENELGQVRKEKDAEARELGRIEGGLDAEKRMLARAKELARTRDVSRPVPLADIEAMAKKVEEATRDVLGTGAGASANDVGTLKKILATVRELVSGFVATYKTRESADTAAEAESEKTIADLSARKVAIEKSLADLARRERTLGSDYTKLQGEIEKEKDTNRDAEKKVFEIHALQNEITAQLATIGAREETVRLETEQFKRELGEAGVIAGRDAATEYAGFEIRGASGVPISEAEILLEARAEQENRRRAIEKIKIRLEDSGLASSDDVMKEFHEVSERDTFLLRELDDLGKSAVSLDTLIDELEQKIETEFKEGIDKINTQFQSFFALMFGGGNASLAVAKAVKKKRNKDTDLSGLLEDETLGGAGAAETMPEEPEEEEGIDINVSLPRKKVKGLMMLSGGERALVSIALIFAMSQVKPPPFIILDETDAALDEANSRKYGDMIENLAKLSQLILITHNRETMSRAGVLYGVTMMSGMSKLLSIQFDEAVVVAK